MTTIIMLVIVVSFFFIIYAFICSMAYEAGKTKLLKHSFLIPEGHAGVKEIKGKFDCIIENSGLTTHKSNEMIHIVDMKEQTIELQHKTLRTRDNKDIDVTARIIYQVIDPVKATYEVSDLRELVRIIFYKHLLDSLETYNHDLLEETDRSLKELNDAFTASISNNSAFESWGVTIKDIIIKNIRATT